MTTATRPPLPLSGLEPFRALFARLHLAGGGRRDVARAIGIVVAALWVPFALLGGVGRVLHGRFEPVVTDGAVHTRLLFALPLTFVAGQVLEMMSSRVFNRLATGDFLSDPSPLARISAGATRWGRSKSVEVLLLVLAIAVAREVGLGGLTRAGPVVGALDAPVTGPAAAWYGYVAFPLFLYGMSRFVWRWLVWGASLWEISRLPLEADPTHPDGAGGLAFLSRPTAALAVLVLGVSAIASASWAPRLAAHEAAPEEFALTFITFFVVAFALAIAPLVPLVGRLVRTFNDGLWDYDWLATVYGRRFAERWIGPAPGPGLVGSADIQSQSDLANVYRDLGRMRFIPFGRREVVDLVGAAVLPMLPLVLTQVPLTKLLPAIAKALVG